jgi:splicing factor 3B subunit 3
MVSSGKEIIIYSTINGGINALCPFESRENVDFFTHLEMYLSKLLENLSGRDHLNYRSYYSPCKGVIDGDLCEVYIKLPYEEQAEIAKLLDLTPH